MTASNDTLTNLFNQFIGREIPATERLCGPTTEEGAYFTNLKDPALIEIERVAEENGLRTSVSGTSIIINDGANAPKLEVLVEKGADQKYHVTKVEPYRIRFSGGAI